jgi:hypothetical protein
MRASRDRAASNCRYSFTGSLTSALSHPFISASPVSVSR